MKDIFILLVVISAMSYSQTSHKTVAPGIILYEKITSKPNLIIHWLVIDQKAGGQVEVELAQDQIMNDDVTKGREAVTNIAARHRAIAAINGDFFPFTGDPLGVCIRAGEIVSEPGYGRAAFGIDILGKPQIFLPGWFGIIKNGDGSSYPLAGINRIPQKDEVVLITSMYGPKFSGAVPYDCVEIPVLSHQPVSGTTITGTSLPDQHNLKSSHIPRGGGLLIAMGKGSDFLKMLTSKVILFGKLTNARTTYKEVIGGGPFLVKDGKVFVDGAAEGFPTSFTDKKNPRTAVGITKKGQIILLSVDGREKLSEGVTLQDLAKLVIHIGAYNAMNLDGGGSTELEVNGCIVNYPSDNSERTIADAIIVYSSKKSTYKLQDAEIWAKSYKLQLGDKIHFQLINRHSGQPIPSKKLVWGCAVGTGFINQAGYLTALRAGDSFVSASLNGMMYRKKVTVVGKSTVAPNVNGPAPVDPDK